MTNAQPVNVQPVIQPIQPSDTQPSFICCPYCHNYEAIGIQNCSKCNTLLILPIQQIPSNNNQLPSPLDSLSIDYVHKGKIHGLLATSCCWIIALFLMIGAYFGAWFTRTPLDNLSVNYYIDHAEYNEDIPTFNKVKYSQCNDDQFKGEECKNMADFENILTPLWLSAFIILAIMTISTILIILPYHIYRCHDNKILLKLSHNTNIDISITFILICSFILFALTFSSFTEFIKSFPYKKYCFYEQYDDDNIGCNWGNGLNSAIAVNIIIFHCTLYLILLLITHRKKSVSSQSIAPSQPLPNENLLAEGMMNYNNNPPINNISSSSKWTSNWLSFLLYIICVIVAAIYLICISVLYIPSSDKASMSYITNRWNTAECFQPDEDPSRYFEYPVEFDYSHEDVCSFTYPNNTNYQMLPEWWSCCQPDACLDAFNYTDLTPFDDYTPCLHALSIITKGSCHPLAADFTPKTYDIEQQSNVTKKNGVFICALYCKQTWDYCQNMRWYKNESVLVSDLFTDSIDFCENGLQVQVRSEIFTDNCLDGAYIHFNVYAISVFLVITLLF